MALLFFDGFDHMGTNNPATVGKWATTAGTMNPATDQIRTGTHSLKFTSGSTSEIITKALAASGGAVVGMAVRVATAFSGADFLQVREGTTVHLAVAISTGGLLSVKRGTTTLATGTTALVLGSWYYIEFKGVIDDAVGSYELRIDGATELSDSGLDTRNAGATGQWDRIRLVGPSSSGNWSWMDDVYICDTSGSIRTDFLGSCKVETIYPQTDGTPNFAPGSNAGLTPSTGTDHGALVDEATPNTSDYNSSATVGLKDTYQYPSLSLTGTILGIQTNLYAAKSDAAVRQVCAVVRAGGTDYDGANVAPTTTFSYFSELRAQNPNTSADWTSADITSLEAGMKVTV